MTRGKRTASAVQAHASELLSYSCGILFCVGLSAILLGQLSQETGIAGYVALAGMLAGNLALGWTSIRGLRSAIVHQLQQRQER